MMHSITKTLLIHSGYEADSEYSTDSECSNSDEFSNAPLPLYPLEIAKQHARSLPAQCDQLLKNALCQPRKDASYTSITQLRIKSILDEISDVHTSLAAAIAIGYLTKAEYKMYTKHEDHSITQLRQTNDHIHGHTSPDMRHQRKIN